MLAMDTIYPAAGLTTLVVSVAGLKLLDRFAGRIPGRIVEAAACQALLRAAGLTVLRSALRRQ